MLLKPAILSTPPVKFGECTREELREYFLNTWDLYETLKRSINDRSHFYVAPDPLRHPLIFYLGHTACFYINKLKASGYLSQGLNSRYESLLAVGVDPESSDDLEKGINWPEVEDVWAYRDQVRQVVLDYIENAPLIDSVDMNSSMWALHMAFEHERIHFETSSVLMRQYPVEYLTRPDGWEYAPYENLNKPAFEMVSFTGGEVQLGKPNNFPTYGWDNEYGDLTVRVDPFAIGNLMVTNREFLEFVNSGGYQDQSFWTEEGWDWVTEESMAYPKFWIRQDGGEFRYRAMFDILDLPMDWPAEVTAYEAEAYLKWKGGGLRLMSEAEWKFATAHAPETNGDPAFCTLHNLSLAYGSPTPVGHYGNGCTPNGVYDLYGNVWDWLSDDFYPLPGFEVHPWYKDFSQPYMDDQHGMMAGGSWASSGTSASKYYRLWFRRGFFQHAGFRVATSL